MESAPAKTILGSLVLPILIYYWYHRLHHEVRIFWASHIVHHSSEHHNLSTVLRQQWTGVTTRVSASATA